MYTCTSTSLAIALDASLCTDTNILLQNIFYTFSQVCVCVSHSTGKIARQVLSALERHYMFFTRKWIETFQPSILPLPNQPEMVKVFLKQLSGNDGLVTFLASIVTDQNFPRQHGMLLQCVYGE